MGPFYVGTIVLFGQQGLRGQRMLDINGVGQGDHAAVLGAEFGPDPERTLWNGDDDGARRDRSVGEPSLLVRQPQPACIPPLRSRVSPMSACCTGVAELRTCMPISAEVSRAT